jgi:hypothetical protein
MDVADVLDQRPGTLRVAACPDVVDEDIGTLGQVTRPSGEDGTTIPRRPAAFDHVVAEATQGFGLLAGEVEIVMDNEDPSHVTPPRKGTNPFHVDR